MSRLLERYPPQTMDEGLRKSVDRLKLGMNTVGCLLSDLEFMRSCERRKVFCLSCFCVISWILSAEESHVRA